MTYYAVTLEFDRESEHKMQEMIDEVAKVTGCDLMKQQNVPPHVTVCCLEGDNDDVLLSEMEAIASSMRKSTIRFASIGVFNPLVIYLGPIMNEFLWNTCRMVNERLLQFAEVGNKGNYLPNRWVPHAGIALKLTPQAVSRWESEAGLPDVSMIVPIAQTLNITTDALLGYHAKSHDDRITEQVFAKMKEFEDVEHPGQSALAMCDWCEGILNAYAKKPEFVADVFPWVWKKFNFSKMSAYLRAGKEDAAKEVCDTYLTEIKGNGMLSETEYLAIEKELREKIYIL